MSNTDVKDPLLPGTVDVSLQSRLKKVLERRKNHGCGSAPGDEVLHPEHNDVKTSHPPDSFAPNSLKFRHVFLFLAVYLGIGAVCFFLVRDQIDGKKTNEVLDAIYFCVVTMTTVGYGDLVPSTTLAKFLACVFVFAGMALVGFVLSKAADRFLEKQEILFSKAIHLGKDYNSTELADVVGPNKVKYKFLTTLVLLVGLMIAGTLFVVFVEGLAVFDAFYCVCATITTLGYGDKSFSTKSGRIFASFWIVISTICLARLFYYFAEVCTEQRQRSMIECALTRKLTVSDLRAADLDNNDEVSPAEFIVYKLKEMGKITDEDVTTVMKGFKMLDVDLSGTLTESDIV
ncbi:PREDICTED: two-pore potassium channel 1-like [Ipomoea nil]|uniref:two-pore potassium channel 1-like n=1 Tax=Ipomoea nil TaxID=35883 RepID=UPI000900A46E|nr:PREDICTED: two-pore potassium channel 1-like [Ipomoea nil]XP_019179137.1 PREDICTED: two-pore potassium channel 1-like [Ipomoea nil]XP_019179138.1 PREDICTED: two-pore potassium channel 1-like [Ipomoea nil]